VKDVPGARLGREINPAIGTVKNQKTHAAPRDICSENIVVVITPMPQTSRCNAKEQRQSRKRIQQQSAVAIHDFNMREECRRLHGTGISPSIG
jgi:hypothetical protein